MALPPLLNLLCPRSKTSYPPHIGTFRTDFQSGWLHIRISLELFQDFNFQFLFSGCVFTKNTFNGSLLKKIGKYEYISILRVFQSVKSLRIEWFLFFYKEYIMNIMELFDFYMRMLPLILRVFFLFC